MGHQRTLMSSCYAMEGLARGSWGGKVVFTITPDLRRPISDRFQEKQKDTGVSHTIRLSTGLHRNEMTAGPTLNIICVESARGPRTAPEYRPLHTRNESVFVHARRRMFPFLLNWNVGMGEGCRSDRGGDSNLRGLSHSPQSALLSERVQVLAVALSCMTVQFYAPLESSIAVAQ